MTTLVLRGPDWHLPFHIHLDALDYAIGTVLGQEDKEKSHYAIYYISKNLVGAEKNYTTTEKEFLAVVYAINKFKHYIIGYQVFFHTNHTAIRYLMNKPIVSGRIIRWLLLLQEFNVTIVDKPNKANVVADFLSRILSEKEDVPVQDHFPDEQLFAISVHLPWFADIANYLARRKFPPHFSSRQQK